MHIKLFGKELFSAGKSESRGELIIGSAVQAYSSDNSKSKFRELYT